MFLFKFKRLHLLCMLDTFVLSSVLHTTSVLTGAARPCEDFESSAWSLHVTVTFAGSPFVPPWLEQRPLLLLLRWTESVTADFSRTEQTGPKGLEDLASEWPALVGVMSVFDLHKEKWSNQKEATWDILTAVNGESYTLHVELLFVLRSESGSFDFRKYKNNSFSFCTVLISRDPVSSLNFWAAIQRSSVKIINIEKFTLILRLNLVNLNPSVC